MKTFIGKVISCKTAKTAIVLVETRRRHPLYKKVVKTKKKYHVHDEFGVKEGDKVKIQECRPISKTKKWKTVEIIKNPKHEAPNPKQI
jgi:small subunit ribosomal protein S17